MGELYLGVMSGTSLDGIDIALARIGQPFSIELVGFKTVPFEEELRREYLAMMKDPSWEPQRLLAVHHLLGDRFGQEINASLRGTMEIRGTTHPLSFAAAVSPQGDETVGVHGTFQFDRTRWGSRYGSGKFYQCLGPHLVHDTITITVRLVATR